MTTQQDNGSLLSGYIAPQSSILVKSRVKRLSRRTKVVLVLLLVPLILSSGYATWFGIIGSGLPMARTTRFHIEGGLPNEILVGPDHNLWFNYVLLPERGLDAHLGSITPDGQRTSIHLPYPQGFNSYYHVTDLSVGPDGAIWGLALLWNISQSVLNGSDAILRLESRTGAVTFYPKKLVDRSLVGAERPNGVVAGRDGFIWYTGDVEVLHNDIAPAVSRLDPRTGDIKRYFLPFQAPPGTLQHVAEMGHIVQVPDGDLWFPVKYVGNGVYNDVEVLGQLHPQTGVFRSIILPNVAHVNTFEAENPNGAAENENPLLLPTSGGGVWVLRTLLPSKPGSDSFLTLLDYVSPTGQVTVMSAPDHGLIEGFALAPDNTLWVVYRAPYHWPLLPIVTQENRLARVSPGGAFTSVCRLPGGDITNIAIGSDAQLWVAVDDHPGVDIEKMALPQ